GLGHSWTETVLYAFRSAPDGVGPEAGLVFDAAGNLYGTTSYGGNFDLGTVFQLRPPVQQGGSWTESVLYNFSGLDGRHPTAPLLIDGLGSLYGTTPDGGPGNFGSGVFFELSPPSQPGDPWTQSILHVFGETSEDGTLPVGGLAHWRRGFIGATSYGG